MITPFVQMLMITVIFGNVFDLPMRDYAQYVFSGVIVWDYILGVSIGGCNSILTSEAYIKQFKNPMVIYPLKTTLVNITTFLIAIQALYIWILFTTPSNLIFGMITLPIAAICLFVLGWPIAILTSTINIKYRDFNQVLVLVMQLIWYMSPVLIKPNLLKNENVSAVIEHNPVTHIINLVRTPILEGTLPSSTDFTYVIVLVLILYAIAIWRMQRVENTLIFYF